MDEALSGTPGHSIFEKAPDGSKIPGGRQGGVGEQALPEGGEADEVFAVRAIAVDEDDQLPGRAAGRGRSCRRVVESSGVAVGPTLQPSGFFTTLARQRLQYVQGRSARSWPRRKISTRSLLAMSGRAMLTASQSRRSSAAAMTIRGSVATSKVERKSASRVALPPTWKAIIAAEAEPAARRWLAWWIWSFAHIYFLIGMRNRTLVAIQWFWNYLSYGRGARLIVGKEWRAYGANAP